MSLKDDLVGLERGFWDASGDGSYYESRMSESGWCLLPVGRLDKVATIEAVRQAEPWSWYRFDDIEAIDASEVAFLHYRVIARRSGGDEYAALVATAYRHDGHSWQLLLHQQTPLG